ncbi:SDR family NAD(P)-dependent oxidoreductase [Zavarzinia sp. CC-PAN008]|uniref:SDR family NAD(P)-dependent oxidoreductase n=1 Tax=Zavarzinia sp. CC-PAN008 TaxID=3243332 RepID=UPI003F74ABE0
MGQVSGKVAIVTGAASGIGRASALVLAREGAAVVATDIDRDGLASLEREIRDGGGKVLTLEHDVVDEDRWIAVVADAEQTFCGLHILVNNAGIGIAGPVWEMTLADWRRQNAINLDGVFLGTKHAIPAMRRAGSGSIIIISSVAGLKGAPGLAGYCATKGGVRLFAKAVAGECARAGDRIRVNSIHPGVIETAIWNKVSSGADSLAGAGQVGAVVANRIDPAILAQAIVPGGVLGQPTDIANAVLFLASDAAAYVSGAELAVDHAQSAI